VETELATRYLKPFTEQAWHVLEPVTDFTPGWHLDAVADHLESVALGIGKPDAPGAIRRLIINIPPRHSKSLLVSAMFPSWLWINHPAFRSITASYGQDLAVRDAVKMRRLITSNWYQNRWSDRYQLTGDQNAKQRYENDKTGYRIATSVDGIATGEGGDGIFIDDPHNIKDSLSPVKLQSVIDWFDMVIQTRLNNPKTGFIVLIMQRCHERDLTGHILSKELGYTHLCLPARYERNHPQAWPADPRSVDGELLWPSMYGETELLSLEKSMGTYAAAGQLQQRPTPREGGMIKRGWFTIVEALPAAHRRTVRFWDRASTEKTRLNDPDWTAGAKLSCHEGLIYIEHIDAFQASSHENEKRIKQRAIMDGPDVQVFMEEEPGSSGKDTISHYSRNVLQGVAFRGRRSTGPKESYIDVIAAQAEAGNVRLLKGDWNEAFLKQCEQWPMGAHDDYIDAVAKAYAEISANSVNIRDLSDNVDMDVIDENTARAEELRAYQNINPSMIEATPTSIFRDPEAY